MSGASAYWALKYLDIWQGNKEPETQSKKLQVVKAEGRTEIKINVGLLVAVCFASLFVGLLMVLWFGQPNQYSFAVELGGAFIELILLFIGVPYALTSGE